MIARPQICLVTAGRLGGAEGQATDELVASVVFSIGEAVAGGIDVIQVREPHLEVRRLTGFVAQVVGIARPSGVKVLVNDRADVALAAGADGVHLRGDGPAVARVRDLGPPGWIVGRSVHSTAEAAAHADADYLLFGTVFRSRSKPTDAPVQGIDALRAVALAVETPVWAIGGIDESTAVDAVQAGAKGVAAMGVFARNARARAAAVRRAVAGVFGDLLE